MTTTTEAALLAAVVARPHDDTPRLVYADWLDENPSDPVPCETCGHWSDDTRDRNGVCGIYCPHCDGAGTVPDGRAARAEFIRVQVELARTVCSSACNLRAAGVRSNGCVCERNALRRRERELFATHGAAWFGPRACLTPPSEREERAGGEWLVVRRGFVSEVRVPTVAAWLGGECGRCVGNNLPPRVPLAGGGSLTCTPCSGTGRTPGIGPAAVAAHPVTRVAVADREPFEDGRGSHLWFRHAGRATAGVADLPAEVFGSLPGEREHGAAIYPTRDLALAALSDALLAAVR